MPRINLGTFYKDNTVFLTANFVDKDLTTPIDADGVVKFILQDSLEKEISELDADKTEGATGEYTHTWLPLEKGNYIIKFEGVVSGNETTIPYTATVI